MDVYEELELSNGEDYLEHHGVLGMHWGVRKYQNADGSLTTAGKQRYYSKVTKGDGYTQRNLGEAGHKYNKKAMAAADRYADALAYNVKRVNKDYDKTFSEYKELREKNNAHYLNERDKWGKQQGKYKGKDYYQFKDISADDWYGSEDSKKERAAREKLKKMVTSAAKEHPSFDKTFKRLKDVNIFEDDLPEKDLVIQMETIKMGEYAIQKVMNQIDLEARKDFK